MMSSPANPKDQKDLGRREKNWREFQTHRLVDPPQEGCERDKQTHFSSAPKIYHSTDSDHDYHTIFSKRNLPRHGV
jgi:hypothetical protein